MFRPVQRNIKYLERFEYCCKKCGGKGSVVDVLLNSDVLLIRGFCSACNQRGTYKVIDIDALRQEHEEIALAEPEAADPLRDSPVVWRWELQKAQSDKPKK